MADKKKKGRDKATTKTARGKRAFKVMLTRIVFARGHGLFRGGDYTIVVFWGRSKEHYRWWQYRKRFQWSKRMTEHQDRTFERRWGSQF